MPTAWAARRMATAPPDASIRTAISRAASISFGDAAAVFDGCRIESKAAGYVTAHSNTYPAQYSGYVLWNSRLTGANTGAGVYLGRPWRAYATVMYLNCELGSHTRPPGWSIWSGTHNHLTATYGEYQSTGPGANPGARVPWSQQLSDAEAAQYAISVFLAGSDGWDPTQ